MSQNLGNQSPSAGDIAHGHHEGFTTMGTNQKIKTKTITDVLHERIQAFVQKPEMAGQGESGQSFAAEFSQLKIENDMVNVFFDEIHKISDSFVFNFIETLKQDVSLTLLSSLLGCACRSTSS